MDMIKSWAASRGVWGGVVAVAGALGGLFGYTLVDADQASLVEALSQIASAVGGVVAIWGRVTASKKIG